MDYTRLALDDLISPYNSSIIQLTKMFRKCNELLSTSLPTSNIIKKQLVHFISLFESRHATDLDFCDWVGQNIHPSAMTFPCLAELRHNFCISGTARVQHRVRMNSNSNWFYPWCSEWKCTVSFVDLVCLNQLLQSCKYYCHHDQNGNYIWGMNWT